MSHRFNELIDSTELLILDMKATKTITPDLSKRLQLNATALYAELRDPQRRETSSRLRTRLFAAHSDMLGRAVVPYKR